MDHETNVKQTVPFFNVTEIEKSVRFYVDGLGFRKTKEWTPEGKLRWCWLELGQTAVMLQEYAKEGHGGRRPEGALGQGVAISFQCEDALKLYREFISRGVQASRPFVGNNMWVTSVTDPDGYRLEFESLTDAPEESVYSENDPMPG